jgi:ketosteroid isomerase-like protein
MSDMTPGRTQLLQNLYEAFNRREFEKVLALMRPDVKWANGMEGGFVHGRNAVREYWRKQFEVTQSRLEPLSFETDEGGRNIVTVHLVVRDLGGNQLAERTVQQIFTIEDGLISLFETAGTGPLHLTDNANGR